MSAATQGPKQGPKQGPGMRSIGRSTLIYGAGVVLSNAVSIIMMPIYTRALTPADYGVMHLINMTLDFITIVAGAKIAVGIFRYYHKAQTEDERRAVVSTAFIALGVSYGAVGALAFLLAGPISVAIFRSAVHVEPIRIAAINLACQSLIMVPLSYARLRDQSTLFVAANALKLFIGLTLNVVLVVYGKMGVTGVFIASLTSTVVVGLGLSVYLIRQVGFHFSRAATRDLLRYGVPLIGTQIAAFVLTFGDRYLLERWMNTTAVGLYSLAYTFGFILANIGYIPFEQVWEPARFEIAKRPDRDQMFARAFIYMNLILVSVAVGMSLFVGDLLRVMAAPAFHSAAELVPVILVAFILQGWTSMHDVGMLMKERTELVTVATWIAAIVVVVAYVLLIPRFGGWGAAWATVIALSVRAALTYTFSQRLWPVAYRWGPVVRLVAIAAAVVLVGIMLPETGLWRSVAMRSLLYLGYILAVWFLGPLSQEDRSLVRKLVRSPRTALLGLRSA